jgi:hypothetical protein
MRKPRLGSDAGFSFTKGSDESVTYLYGSPDEVLRRIQGRMEYLGGTAFNHATTVGHRSQA